MQTHAFNAGPQPRPREAALTSNERAAAVERFAPVVDGLDGCTTLEEAAQRFCDLFYGAFTDTTLVRVFGTVPLGRLGRRELAFIDALIAREPRPMRLGQNDPVLTLFGTRGIEPAWCSREASTGHLAIPLASEEFVAEIPMLARLLSELGFGSLGARNGSWQFVSRVPAGSDGLFFVGDARTATDERGRLIIPAAEFVERYHVRSVFGFGGEVAGQSMMLSTIVFSRGVLAREEAAAFVPLFGRLRDATRAVLERQAWFATAS
jgi:hypothetical protein